MVKKSKLIEKSSRIATSFEEKLKVDLRKYQEDVRSANNETARSLLFYSLLRDWFCNVRQTFVEEYLRGIEKYVKIKGKDFIVRGRIDALYGNAIIELESDLKKKLREAQSQLKNYLFCLLSDKKEREINYLCIATDGMLFNVYVPRWKNPEALPNMPDEIELREIGYSLGHLLTFSSKKRNLPLDDLSYVLDMKIEKVPEFIDWTHKELQG